ncbi:MAG: ATP-binding cassette domain-containing protein [Clostridia bacterium]|nr:ATP-binding cassette domain-containing protein [Deltaproteobacteria bacterium]
MNEPYEFPLEVKNLTAKYGERVIMSGVSMHVRKGTIHVILGGSGSGKSTFLKHVVGLMMPAAGEVRLLGMNIAEADEPEYEATMCRVGMLFQGGALLNSLTLHENVALPLQEMTTLSKSVIDDIVRMKLEQVSLLHAAERVPPELSGGMKKRAALARAMALDPEILFCDEPSAGLDPITAVELDHLLIDLRERFGMTIVVVTHELASIELISDDVTMLGRGSLIATGDFRKIRQDDDPRVRAFFDRIAGKTDDVQTVLGALGGKP